MNTVEEMMNGRLERDLEKFDYFCKNHVDFQGGYLSKLSFENHDESYLKNLMRSIKEKSIHSHEVEVDMEMEIVHANFKNDLRYKLNVKLEEY